MIEPYQKCLGEKRKMRSFKKRRTNLKERLKYWHSLTMEVASILHLIGQVGSGIFAGAALYIALVQMPSMAGLTNEELLVIFKALYIRAARMQATLTTVSSAALIGSFFFQRDWWTLGAGFLMTSIIPYTLRFMLPVNQQFITTPAGSGASKPFPQLLSTWGKLHWYRTFASTAAFCIMTWIQYRS